jgi:putative toxin-antitoxin system antitoxin component (TIGR02293 family)
MALTNTHSLARLLGLRAEIDLSAEIEIALSATAANRLCRLVAPDDVNFFNRIVKRSQLARRRERRLNLEESNRLFRLATVWLAALDVWHSEKETRRFLARPHPLLCNCIPRELAIESQIGLRAVENVLGGLKYGVAV